LLAHDRCVFAGYLSGIVIARGHDRRGNLPVFSKVLIRIVVAALPGVIGWNSVAAATPVVVVVAESREMTPVIQVAGTVISQKDTRLAAQVEGQVIWVADVGNTLAAGDVAARLDDVLLRAMLTEEEAQVSRAQASLTFHQAESQRLAKLASENHAAQSRLDQERRDASIARSELAAAKSRVTQIREKLDRTAIKAPFAGVVTEEFIQAGEWADPGTAIVRLVDTGSLEIQAWVPVRALPYIHGSSTLQYMLGDRPGSGRVTTLVPVGDDLSRLFELRLTPDDKAITSGQSVRIAIPTADAQQAVAIPRDSLVLRRDGASVFRILDDNTAERVRVTTGMAQGEFIEVRGGIQAGDRIVIRGGERLRPGQEVELQEQVSGE
jgi:RND family efflux transporter MFP subunit